MRCHYDILGLSVNCTFEELKKAYRKLALEWHPDKNLDRLEEATETFQLIQQAYEILADPQERSWYDRHRDDILKGGRESNYKDDCLDVYQYFNTSCYKGYNDEEKGFYTVYRNVFTQIYSEDKPFMEEELDVPEFGCSTSPYDEVVHVFYGYWQSYCTSKSYSWVDKFDLSESRKSGAGRQIIRLMDKENKKIRDQHKKMRNEEVRELVAFVRKRDKRVQAHKVQMEEAREVKAKKMEEDRKRQIAERNKTLKNYQDHEWSSMSQFENHFNEIESSLDNAFGNSIENRAEDEDDTLGDLYCIACDKDFRSLKSMENHENSKKHKENVLFLKATMEEEEQAPPSSSSILDEEDSPPEESSEALLGELIKSSSKSKKKKKKKLADSTAECKVSNEVICDIDSRLNEVILDDCCDTNTSNEKIPHTDVDSRSSTKNKPTAKKKGRKENSKDQPNITNVESTHSVADEKPSTVCEVCKNDFSSRNKLFDHIKKTGHAVYKTDDKKMSNRTESETKKKKSKR